MPSLAWVALDVQSGCVIPAHAEELLQTRHQPRQPCWHIIPILFGGLMEKIQPSAPAPAAGRQG